MYLTARRRRPIEKAGADDGIGFSVTAETWRFYAYLSFWGMVAFAKIVTSVSVVGSLARGPEDGKACGAFARDNPDFGVYPGEGFDFKTQSHLMMLFGFNNICTNWDYTPARELTAMVYPLFEYPLMIYLCFDFAATALANQRGELHGWFWSLSKAMFPINFFLCAQFRMIFVFLAYENVQGHTAGFLGLQVSLILVALQNVGFILDANIAYEELGGPGGGHRNTRIAALAYLAGDLVICALKISATVYVVRHGHGAGWTMRPSPFPGWKVGQLVDVVWMVFNALLPLLVSYFRSKNEKPIAVVLSQGAGPYIGGHDDEVTEQTPLRP